MTSEHMARSCGAGCRSWEMTVDARTASSPAPLVLAKTRPAAVRVEEATEATTIHRGMNESGFLRGNGVAVGVEAVHFLCLRVKILIIEVVHDLTARRCP